MVAFGPKQAWLAIQDRSHGPVAAALGLRELGTVDWRSGVDLAYLTDDRLALTPGLPGARGIDWTLVTGRWLLANASTVDIVALSTELRTEVQAFSTYRYGEQHRWQRAVDGVLVRAFGYAGTEGEVTQWFGDPDETVTTEVDARDYLDAKMDAMRAHATQITTDGPFFALSNHVGHRAFGMEFYRLVRGTLPKVGPLAGTRENDLFEGI